MGKSPGGRREGQPGMTTPPERLGQMGNMAKNQLSPGRMTDGRGQ